MITYETYSHYKSHLAVHLDISGSAVITAIGDACDRARPFYVRMRKDIITFLEFRDPEGDFTDSYYPRVRDFSHEGVVYFPHTRKHINHAKSVFNHRIEMLRIGHEEIELMKTKGHEWRVLRRKRLEREAVEKAELMQKQAALNG